MFDETLELQSKDAPQITLVCHGTKIVFSSRSANPRSIVAVIVLQALHSAVMAMEAAKRITGEINERDPAASDRWAPAFRSPWYHRGACRIASIPMRDFAWHIYVDRLPPSRARAPAAVGWNI